MKRLSQNVVFKLDGRGRGHPPGRKVLFRVRKMLRERGVECARLEDWRDCGWSFTAKLAGHSMDVTIGTGPFMQGWFLQVAPERKPFSFWKRWFAEQPDGVSLALGRLSLMIDESLHEAGASELHWRWDGPPEESDPEHPPMDE